LLHIDSTWEFRDVLAFRDRFAKEYGFSLVVHRNEAGFAQGINPFEHGDLYTTTMRTEALKQALDEGGYDVIFGGARRDEEASRAKERVVSVRSASHGWDPKNQRPEPWKAWNWRLNAGQSIRAFPLSNWSEYDLWTYIVRNRIELAAPYYAAPRQVVERAGKLIVVDEPERMHWLSEDRLSEATVRFRTLGCWPVTAATPSTAATLEDIAMDTFTARTSERQGRISDNGSLEQQKRSGYF
jgi:sulfate adenylyltransferase subunit 2